VQLGDAVGDVLGEGLGEGLGDHAWCRHAGQPVGLADGGAGADGFGAGVGATGGATAAAKMAAFFAVCVAACVAAFDDCGAGALEAGSLECAGAGVAEGGTGHAVDTKTEPLTTLPAGPGDEPLAKVRPRAVSEATPTTVAPAFAPMAQAVALNRTAIFRPPSDPRRMNARFAH
jgi:hypothetical protein